MDEVCNLKLELQQNYASRTELQTLAAQPLAKKPFTRSSDAGSASWYTHAHSQGDGVEKEGSVMQVWRVKNVEQARELLRSELEQCIQQLRSESAASETAVRSVCNSFESKVEREIGRLDQARIEVDTKANKLAAELEAQGMEVAATQERSVESIKGIEKRLQAHQDQQHDELTSTTSQLRADFVTQMSVQHEEFWRQCRDVAVAVDELSNTLEDRMHSVCVREAQAREGLHNLLIQESKNSSNAMRADIKELEELFKGVASKWDEQTSHKLMKQEEAANEANASLSERIHAAEAVAIQGLAGLQNDLEERLDILAADICGFNSVAEQAAAGHTARMSRDLTAMINRATEKLEETQAETTRKDRLCQQELQEQILHLQEEWQDNLARIDGLQSDLQQETCCKHQSLSSRLDDFEADLSARVERECTGMHATLAEGLRNAAASTSAVRGEISGVIERTKSELARSLTNNINDLSIQSQRSHDELSRTVEEQRSSVVHRLSEIKDLVHTAESRVESKLGKMIVETSTAAERGQGALQCKLENIERQMTVLMRSQLDDSARAQSEALESAIANLTATVTADMNKMQDEMLKQLKAVQAAGTQQCTDAVTESRCQLDDSCGELRRQIESMKCAAFDKVEDLRDSIRQHTEERAQTLQATIGQIARTLEDEKTARVAAIDQLKDASEAFRSRTAQGVQEACSEVRRNVEERIESLKRDQARCDAKISAIATSLQKQHHETTETVHQNRHELHETRKKLLEIEVTFRGQLREQSAVFEENLATRVGGVTGGLLSLAEATEQKHTEMELMLSQLEQHLVETIVDRVTVLEDRVTDNLDPMSMRLTELATECTSCTTRIALQNVDFEELRQAVLDLDDALSFTQLENQLDALQDEVAEMATELSLFAAVTEAASHPHQ